MKKSYFAVVFALTCVLGLGISAHSQDASTVVVSVPFEFVVDGSRIMPAGTYSVSRVSPDSHSGLIIRSYNNSALLLPILVDGVSGGDSKLGFERVGDKYFLSKVETPERVYTIAIPRVTKLAQLKVHGIVSSSGAN